MKDQHAKISGYRDLTQEEIDLMNAAKALEAECLKFHAKVERTLQGRRNALDARLSESAASQHDENEYQRMTAAQPFRWLAIARTDIETGFMALVRAVAQPQPKE